MTTKHIAALANLRIKLVDENEITEDEMYELYLHAKKVGKTRIGRIASFLEVEKNISYSDAFKQGLLKTDTILFLEYKLVFSIIEVLKNIGSHKTSIISRNDESTAFNSKINSETLMISDVILESLNKSKSEHESKVLSAGALIACQYLMNEKGYERRTLLNAAKHCSLMDLFFDVYSYDRNKNRSGYFGAGEIVRIHNSSVSKQNAKKSA